MFFFIWTQKSPEMAGMSGAPFSTFDHKMSLVCNMQASSYDWSPFTLVCQFYKYLASERY